MYNLYIVIRVTDEMENTTVVYKAQNVLLYYSW
jgi:hypothetical protein